MQRIGGATRQHAPIPGACCVEWVDPLMMAGNWTPELVTLAGGENLLSNEGEHSPVVPWEDLRRADPSVIVSMPCGFDLSRTREETAALTRLPGWDRLAAVQGGRVYVTDGHQFFNRPGPRLVESLEIMAEILHPERVRLRPSRAALLEPVASVTPDRDRLGVQTVDL